MLGRRLVLPALLLALTSCSYIADMIPKSLQERLVGEVLTRWASPGEPFMDGALGRDTVGTVTETAPRTWEVTAGATYALEVTRAHVYPVFSNGEYARWLSDRGRALGMRTFVPEDVLALISSGRIIAVGDLAVEFGDASRSGRSTWERVAYLREEGEVGTSWSIQPEVRSATVLRDALRLVYDDLMFTDDRVMDCLGSASPGTVERQRALDCVGTVLEGEYGDGAGT